MRSLRETGRWMRSRWMVAVGAVVLIAFIAGLAFAYVQRMEAKTTAGSSTKPETGNYLYLPLIDRYFSLPDDVELYRTVQLGSCDSEIRCPVFPVLFYQRGEARIAIDQVGQIFEEIEGGGGDASAFPFFTGEEEHEDLTVAQEGSTDLPPPPPHLVATPDGPIPTMDLTKYPIIAEKDPYTAPVERMEPKSDAGSSTKPVTGNYLYLPLIERYYSLPDDVKLIHDIELVSCIPEEPCPVTPFLIYQRGEAIIGIDQVGEIFEDIGEGADASAFPFFTGKVSNAEHNSLEPLLRRYDANDNGMIDKDEAVAAVLDYFDGLISKDEALAVVATYYST